MIHCLKYSVGVLKKLNWHKSPFFVTMNFIIALSFLISDLSSKSLFVSMCELMNFLKSPLNKGLYVTK